MFLGQGYTQHCMNPTKAEQNPVLFADTRAALVGNAFHAGVVALLLAPLLASEGYLSEIPSPDDLVQRMGLYPGETYYAGLDCSLSRKHDPHRHDGRPRGVVEPSAAAALAAVSPRSTVALEQLLFHNLVRSSDYRGSDVRLDSGKLFRPASWPRRSIDTGRWVWYTMVAHRFERPEHINVLELRSTLLSLRWRTRAAKRIFTRFVHLQDSQVALAVLVKGRSSSQQLNRVLRKISALTLAASLMPSYGFTSSKWNPGDPPSRFWESGRARRSAFPRRARRKPRTSAADKAKREAAKSRKRQGDAAPEDGSRRNQKFARTF